MLDTKDVGKIKEAIGGPLKKYLAMLTMPPSLSIMVSSTTNPRVRIGSAAPRLNLDPATVATLAKGALSDAYAGAVTSGAGRRLQSTPSTFEAMAKALLQGGAADTPSFQDNLQAQANEMAQEAAMVAVKEAEGWAKARLAEGITGTTTFAGVTVRY